MILDAHILSVNVTILAETSLEYRHERCKRGGRARADETNYWCRRLLRVCPAGHTAAPPISVMNERRFTAFLPFLRPKG
jgi:hypothetical protein